MDLRVLIILFLFYTFVGAIAEHLSYFIDRLIDKKSKLKSLSNPIITGFPIYGIGALIIIWLRKLVMIYNIPIVIEFLIYGSALEMLEMISGVIVRAGSTSYDICDGDKKCVSSWDYSASKWNILGMIDLKHFLLFGLAGMIVSRANPYLQHRVEKAFE